MKDRNLYKTIWDDVSADKSLILLAGPRQSGKTTFARKILAKGFPDSVYFNWDLPTDKSRLISDPAFFDKEPRSRISSKPLVIFDELHKFRDWKNYLKGVYDRFSEEYHFLVMGSGRLEYSRKAGDSLAGRFLKFHLFPFTLAELAENRRPFQRFKENPLDGCDDNSPASTSSLFQSLWEFGGFPEPFSKGRKAFWRTWSNAYGQQIVRDDIRTVADIRNLDHLETLFALLPSRVGSMLSMNNLAGDLQVAFDSVKNWLLLFDAFYLTFRLSPWTAKITRSLVKERKLYLFNFPVIEDEGARFENLVAVELLRAVEVWNDLGLGFFSLHFLRDKEKRGVDFLLAENHIPFLVVETKAGGDTPADSLMAYQKLLNVPAVQLTRLEGVKRYFKNGTHPVLVITAHRWLASLP
ncbi:hypothetical protein AUK22_10630 [bacterium CG2_30_54_10]|nr:MAG: hypothetical protein AUK22_10630 [bacterium CG2_30_54_10]